MGTSFTKAILPVFLVLMLVINTGGLFSGGMRMDGIMSNCPYMSVPTLCDMSPLEHLSALQSMFSATVQQFASASLLSLIVLALFWHFVGYLFLPKYAEVLVPRSRYRERVFDPLRLAFARGIIHTKVF